MLKNFCEQYLSPEITLIAVHLLTKSQWLTLNEVTDLDLTSFISTR